MSKDYASLRRSLKIAQQSEIKAKRIAEDAVRARDGRASLVTIEISGTARRDEIQVLRVRTVVDERMYMMAHDRAGWLESMDRDALLKIVLALTESGALRRDVEDNRGHRGEERNITHELRVVSAKNFKTPTKEQHHA